MSDPEPKKRGRPRKVVEPAETTEPLESTPEAVPEPESTPEAEEPIPANPKPRGRPKKVQVELTPAPVTKPVRMKTQPPPTAAQIAGEMIRHLEDRHHGRQQARAAMYASWM